MPTVTGCSVVELDGDLRLRDPVFRKDQITICSNRMKLKSFVVFFKVANCGLNFL